MLSSASEIVSIISTELKPWMESLIRNRWFEFKVKKNTNSTYAYVFTYKVLNSTSSYHKVVQLDLF